MRSNFTPGSYYAIVCGNIFFYHWPKSNKLMIPYYEVGEGRDQYGTFEAAFNEVVRRLQARKE